MSDLSEEPLCIYCGETYVGYTGAICSYCREDRDKWSESEES